MGDRIEKQEGAFVFSRSEEEKAIRRANGKKFEMKRSENRVVTYLDTVEVSYEDKHGITRTNAESLQQIRETFLENVEELMQEDKIPDQTAIDCLNAKN